MAKRKIGGEPIQPDDVIIDDKRQTSVLARYERKLLEWINPRIPAWITPDILTYTALFASIGVFVSYVLAGVNLWYLWAVNIFIFIHWFADSTDGRLAIFRKKPRPNYGHYIDHFFDMIAILLMFTGWALSGLLNIYIATLWVLLLYFWTFHSSFRETYTISYYGVGFTEGRIVGVLLNAILFFYPTFFIKQFHVVEWALIGAFIVGFIALVFQVVNTLLRLKKEDERKWTR